VASVAPIFAASYGCWVVAHYWAHRLHFHDAPALEQVAVNHQQLPLLLVAEKFPFLVLLCLRTTYVV
jgi:uncharacterized membrane protein